MIIKNELEKLQLERGEVFKEFFIDDKRLKRYAVSNKGRIISFNSDIKFGKLLKGAMIDGYRFFKYKTTIDGKIKSKHFFISKLVAENFIPKADENQTYVLHLDRVRDNDDVKNLQWATREEMLEFGRKSPFVLAAKKKFQEDNLKANGTKLTITKVMVIKKILAKPEQTTRIKMIAKQFGVTPEHIRKIKKGICWDRVEV